MSMTSAADARSQAVSPAEMLFGIRYLPSESVRDRGAAVSDGRALRGLRFGRGDGREAGREPVAKATHVLDAEFAPRVLKLRAEPPDRRPQQVRPRLVLLSWPSGTE